MSTARTSASLEALQTWLLRALTRQAGDPDSQTLVADVNRVIKTTQPGRASERLAIYQHAYFARFEECLEDDYPAVKYALGARVFSELCRSYVVNYPSMEPSLNGFGRYFAEHAQKHCLPASDFVADLARLEWSLVEVVHAATPKGMSVDALSRVPPHQLPHLRFVASAALRLLTFRYDVNAYLQAYFDERQPALPEPHVCHVAVVRNAYTLWRFALTPSQANLLTQLMAGASLGVALSSFRATPTEIQAWFADWTSHGFFADCQVVDA